LKHSSHFRLFVIASAIWLGFLIAGLPSYYQQYSARTMAVFDLLILPPIVAIVFVALRGVRPERRLRVALWFAFYFTVPLAIYDWLYCGLYLGHGLAFVSRFWYLSVYYVIPWLVMPGVAIVLGQRGSHPGLDVGAT
jgi:hypothetical protein